MTNLVQTFDVHHTGSDGILYGVSVGSPMVASGVIVASDDLNGVENPGFGLGSYLVNHGDLEGGNDGVLFVGALNNVINEADGLITGGVNGMEVGGFFGTVVFNFGFISGQTTGFDFNGSAGGTILHNHGTIFGATFGVTDASAAVGSNEIDNWASIEGGNDGILIETAATLITVINNAGSIAGGAMAIEADLPSVGAIHLINSGVLTGKVVLADQADIIRNSGQIAGTVHLGGGNDHFDGTGGASGGIFGESGNDRLIGGSGADLLSGGPGVDTLAGGPGHDRFVFDAALGPTNVDRVTDFAHKADKVDLSHAVFTATNPSGTLQAAMFLGGGKETTQTRVIYDPASGFLSYDQDGSGHLHAPIHFATLAAHLTLSNTDFMVVA